MAETPKCKLLQTPKKPRLSQTPNLKYSESPSVPLTPQIPQTLAPLRRSSRRASLPVDPTTPWKLCSATIEPVQDSLRNSRLVTNGEKTDLATPRSSLVDCAKEVIGYSVRTPKQSGEEECAQILNSIEERKSREVPKLGGNGRKSKKNDQSDAADNVSFSPVSPDQSERKRRKKGEEKRVMLTRSKAGKNVKPGVKGKEKDKIKGKKRIYYKKVLYDGGEFELGDDVYVKRREDASSDEEDPDVEECRVCFKSGKSVMIECDDCLHGFHLTCLKPPLKEVPEGDWICGVCEARRSGKQVEFPKPPEGKKWTRTLREKLLSSALWAARIERFESFLSPLI